MAKKIQEILLDDLTGEAADETVTFGLDGVNYEIDLSTENALKLREAISPWAAKSRRIRTTRRTRGTGRVASNNAGEIREWARANGYKVSERGRISAEIQEAYDAAN